LVVDGEASTTKFFLYLDPGSGYRWVLRSHDGERLANSEGAYVDKAECERTIEEAKERYPEAAIRDLTR
jgi:uncharacterized protein YegP (UPF0339 family)